MAGSHDQVAVHLADVPPPPPMLAREPFPSLYPVSLPHLAQFWPVHSPSERHQFSFRPSEVVTTSELRRELDLGAGLLEEYWTVDEYLVCLAAAVLTEVWADLGKADVNAIDPSRQWTGRVVKPTPLKSTFQYGANTVHALPASKMLSLEVLSEALDIFSQYTTVCVEDPRDHRRLVLPVHAIVRSKSESSSRKMISVASSSTSPLASPRRCWRFHPNRNFTLPHFPTHPG